MSEQEAKEFQDKVERLRGLIVKAQGVPMDPAGMLRFLINYIILHPIINQELNNVQQMTIKRILETGEPKRVVEGKVLDEVIGNYEARVKEQNRPKIQPVAFVPSLEQMLRAARNAYAEGKRRRDNMDTAGQQRETRNAGTH